MGINFRWDGDDLVPYLDTIFGPMKLGESESDLRRKQLEQKLNRLLKQKETDKEVMLFLLNYIKLSYIIMEKYVPDWEYVHRDLLEKARDLEKP
ncbi:MAG: hypothetical protein QW838_08190 [Candidatus Nitrosotenuis sp.]